MRTTDLPYPAALAGPNGQSDPDRATAPIDAGPVSDPAESSASTSAGDFTRSGTSSRRINPLALALGFGVVLAGSYVMSTIDPRLSRDPERLRAFHVAAEPQPMETPSMEPRSPQPDGMPGGSSPSYVSRETRQSDNLPRAAAVSDGPDIQVSAAPGVAFSYRFAVRLPAGRIAQVQEQHAAACERLGVDRCRITGLRYRVVGEEEVEAMLALALDPGIARPFGKAGVEAAARAEGSLVDAEISGVDADRSIRAAGRTLARLREDLARIERRLALRNTAEERQRLEDQAERLRQSIRAAESGREEQQDSLATTPLTFQYVTGERMAAEEQPSLGDASRRALDNFLAGMTLLGIIGVTLLPWTLLALALWGLWRLGRRRFGPRAAPAEATA